MQILQYDELFNNASSWLKLFSERHGIPQQHPENPFELLSGSYKGYSGVAFNVSDHVMHQLYSRK
jgi:hypothetical protein